MLLPSAIILFALFFDYNSPNEWNLLSGSTLWFRIGDAYGDDYVGINSANFFSEIEGGF